MSWCGLDLSFVLAVVTLKLKILSGLYLGNCKVYEVDSWMGHWFGSVAMMCHGVIFNLCSAKVCSPAITETYFSYDKDI